MKKMAYQSDGNGGVKKVEVEVNESVFITKNTAYDRIEEKYGKEKLNQVLDILDTLDRINKRRYDDAQDIDCSNSLVISMLQSIGINPEDILY